LENIVVWEDYRNGNADIYMCATDVRDITTWCNTLEEDGGGLRQITDNEFNQMSPTIFASGIAWMDYRDGNPEIYTCDLGEGSCHPGDEEKVVSEDSSYKYNPSISGDRIVWTDKKADHTYSINGYLTIMAAPDAVPYRQYMWTVPSGSHRIFRSLDQTKYADLQNNDGLPDIFTGRIMGISLSDVSGYLARDLFYESIEKTKSLVRLLSERLPQ